MKWWTLFEGETADHFKTDLHVGLTSEEVAVRRKQFGFNELQTMAFTILVVLELVGIQVVRAPYYLKFFSYPLLILAFFSSSISRCLYACAPACI